MRYQKHNINQIKPIRTQNKAICIQSPAIPLQPESQYILSPKNKRGLSLTKDTISVRKVSKPLASKPLGYVDGYYSMYDIIPNLRISDNELNNHSELSIGLSEIESIRGQLGLC